MYGDNKGRIVTLILGIKGLKEMSAYGGVKKCLYVTGTTYEKCCRSLLLSLTQPHGT